MVMANKDISVYLSRDATDLSLSLEKDILDDIMRDPAEVKRRSLYISPIGKNLRQEEMSFTITEFLVGLKQIFPEGSEEFMLINPKLVKIRNAKGYAVVTFHNAEFTEQTKNFFLANRRIFSLQGNLYQFVVPREKEKQIEFFIRGWVQPNISPKIISDFLNQVPNFPKIISVSIPVDKRTGRFNPYFCFVTVEIKDPDQVLKMEIFSNRKKLNISIAYKNDKTVM